MTLPSYAHRPRGDRRRGGDGAQRPLSVLEVAQAFEVPYWLISGEPRPAWWRRPIWRFRALLWRRRG